MLLDRLVLDAFTQAINHLRAGAPDGIQILVRAQKVIARSLFGIAREVGEHGMNVYHVAARPLRIMQAREGNPERTMLVGQVNETACDARSAIDAVQRAQRAVGLGKVDAQFERCLGAQFVTG